MLLRHILGLDALERCMLHSSLAWCTRSDYALGSQVSLMLLPLSSLYGYAMISRCSYSRRDTSHCPLLPVDLSSDSEHVAVKTKTKVNDLSYCILIPSGGLSLSQAKFVHFRLLIMMVMMISSVVVFLIKI